MSVLYELLSKFIAKVGPQLTTWHMNVDAQQRPSQNICSSDRPMYLWVRVSVDWPEKATNQVRCGPHTAEQDEDTDADNGDDDDNYDEAV